MAVMASPSPLSELLFTPNRDFLLNTEGAHVKADAIAGKVVGLLIAPSWIPASLEQILELIADAHEGLEDQPLAFVYVAPPRSENVINSLRRRGQASQLDERPDEECFADVLKQLPNGFFAVPVEDVSACQEIADKFSDDMFTLVFFGADGLVYTDQGLPLLDKWGAEGFPFNDARIAELQKAVEERRANQTLKTLLCERGMDEVISSKDSKKVKVSELEGKVVALYFSAHWCPPCKKFTPILASLYEKLKAKGEDFKIVFISADDSQESFDDYFRQMPWFAVPYEDEETKKHLNKWFEVEGIPKLIILDKQGKTISTEGIRLVYKYGMKAYPFSPERLEELKQIDEAKRVPQTFESLLVTGDRDYVLSKFGQVQVASLTGKTVGFYFSADWCSPCRRFTLKLKSIYDELKDRGENFEVLFLSSDRSKGSFEEYYESMPWLALPFNDAAIRRLSLYFDVEDIPQLVIIGPDGDTVRTDGRELIGQYGSNVFPFTEDRLEEVKAETDRIYKDKPKEDTELHTHPLVLMDDAYDGEVYVCKHCEEPGVSWVYHCEECGYNLHPDCRDKLLIEKQDSSQSIAEKGAQPLEGGVQHPGFVCEGDVCRRI